MIDLGPEGTQATIEYYQSLIQLRQQELDQLIRNLEAWIEHSELAELSNP